MSTNPTTSSGQPDEVTARRLAGMERAAPTGAGLHPVLGDGTLDDTPGQRATLVLGNRSFTDVTNMICGYTENPQPKWWLPLFGLVSSIAGIGGLLIGYLVITGIGTWGLTNQVDWA